MKSEIVGSTKGPSGGFFVAQDFTSLSLFEIYAALEERKVVEFDVADATNASDESTQHYNAYFNAFFGDIQNQIEARMQAIKLEQIKEATDHAKK
jgi:DNA-binding IscR family transcriptional regulator